MKKILLILSALFICMQVAFAQTKYSRVSIPSKQPKIGELQKLGMEFDHYQYIDSIDAYITTVSDVDIDIMHKNNIQYTMLIEDEEAYFLENNKVEDFYKNDKRTRSSTEFKANCSSVNNNFVTPAAFTPGSMGGYYTLAEMYTKLFDLVAAYPTLIMADTLGFTAQNRPIVLFKISDNVQTKELESSILYTGMHHAREPMTIMNLVFYMQYLLANYATDVNISEIVNNRELYFIPCLNPDGYERNRSTNPSGGGNHRKNRNAVNTTLTNYGVDLNRNYSVDFGVDNTGSSSTLTADTYRGPSAFSEAETQAVRAFVNSSNIQMSLDYHAFGNYNLTPYGSPSYHPPMPADVKSFYDYYNPYLSHYSGYTPGDNPSTLGYQVNGGSNDWYVFGDYGIRRKIFTYLIEIGASSDGFWPTASKIIPLAKAQMYNNLQFALISGGYGDIQDNTDIALTSTTGAFNYIYKRLGIRNEKVEISIIPLQGIATVDAPKVLYSSELTTILDQKTGSFNYTLNSGIGTGDKIKFVWKTVTDGITQYDTITKFYNPTVLFADNMETGLITTKWMKTGTWDYSSNTAIQGTKALDLTPTGNYANNSTMDLTLLNAINLSGASEAYLSFWIKCNAQNMQDKLRLLASTNGVGTTATFNNTLCSEHSVTENLGTIGNIPSYTGSQNEWRRQVIDLSSLIGQSNVGLRFSFTSNASTVGDGFYIDDIKIVRSNSTNVIGGNTGGNANQKSFIVYPNPATNAVFLSSKEKAISQFTISNSSGVVVRRLSNLSSYSTVSIDLTDFGKGIYTIEGTNSEGYREQQKLVIN